MGLFDLFRKKRLDEKNENNSGKPSLINFKSYYLYGFTNDPNKIAEDGALFIEVYRKVIGVSGGIAINNSFHPYYIINGKGATVWNAAYMKIAVSEKKDEFLQNIVKNNAAYVVDIASIFNKVNVWSDIRLTYEENPEFSRYMPFIIPFLVYNTGNETQWDYEIRKGIAEKGHASDYVENVTNSLRFFMPAPAFIIGFDEFDEKNPSSLINNFINCKCMISGN